MTDGSDGSDGTGPVLNTVRDDDDEDEQKKGELKLLRDSLLSLRPHCFW